METLTFEPAPVWSQAKTISFKFVFVFFALIIFPFPISVIPGINVITQPYTGLWDVLVQFVGTSLLGLSGPLSSTMTGSGDKLYDWVWYATVLISTVIIAGGWALLDRQGRNYDQLKRWLLLFMVYYLAYFMFVYGIIKLFYLQFRSPSLEQLYQTFGEASPMRLLWTFMGFSKSYTMFAGASETLAGILLVFRNTRTLGGLVAAGVMLNVFVMNMSYDVPVKLFSFQLMLIGLYIAWQDKDRILNVFVLNKTATARNVQPLLSSTKGQRILQVIQVLFVGYIVVSQIIGGISAQKQYGEKREKPPLHGVYNVEQFVANGDTLSPLLTDPLRWKRMLIDYPNFTSIVRMNDNVTRYTTEIDTMAGQFTFSLQQDTVNKYVLDYAHDGSKITLAGVLFSDTINVTFQQKDLNEFGLLGRGFHWVNEVPYNRYNDEFR